MQVRFERVAGLDVHRDTVAACVRVPDARSGRSESVETFGATADGLLALRDWLAANKVTHVAMESTGVFWKPVYYTLEDEFTVLLVNAGHIKNVPGRKTDVKDSQWIAELLEAGLLSPSFVPPPPIRDLRDLTRYRTALIRERGREVQRLHKVLQDAGIKLSSAATDIMGVSGRAMLEALMQGTKDPAILADLAKGKLRKKIPLLRQAMVGHFREHHAFVAREILNHVDYVEAAIERVAERIEECLRPFALYRDLLQTIPGIKAKASAVIIAEMGTDMGQFPSAKHLSSWAGLAPGNNESGGKRKRCGTRKGSRWLRACLVEMALAAIRAKKTSFSGRYYRLRTRLGHKKAVVAVAHAMLVVAYRVMGAGRPYEELGRDYYDRRHQQQHKDRLVRQLQKLGFEVDLRPKENAA